MSKLFRKLFGYSKRAEVAEYVMQQREAEHETAIREMNAQIKTARRAAVESRSAARTLLKRMAEDIPE